MRKWRIRMRKAPRRICFLSRGGCHGREVACGELGEELGGKLGGKLELGRKLGWEHGEELGGELELCGKLGGELIEELIGALMGDKHWHR